MTTQARPKFDETLADQIKATESAEAKARDWQTVADTQRKALDAAIVEIKALQIEVAALERRLAEAQQGCWWEGG